MDLNRKTAWITGGARMGLAVARILSQAGCRIALSYRSSRKPAEEAARQLMGEGGKPPFFGATSLEKHRSTEPRDKLSSASADSIF